MKIRPVGGELFNADRQTDTTKVTVAFRSFGKPPEMNEAKPLLPLCVFMVWPRDKCAST
jgi:hypothetical protein